MVIVFPIYLALVGSTHSAQDMAQSPIPIWFGQDAWLNYRTILFGEGPGVTSQVPVARMMWVSLVTALSIAFGKIVISLLSAFAIVYFNFPFRKAVFWGIFITLMLPVEVRIVPTYQVVADFGMINSFAGLTIPLIASATATFLFRQFFLTVPDELAEAAKMDGASPMQFFWDVLLALVAYQHCGPVCDPVHLWLEPVPMASAHEHRRAHVPHCHGHPQHDRWSRLTSAMELGHGHGHFGHAATHLGGGSNAEVVRQGPR